MPFFWSPLRFPGHSGHPSAPRSLHHLPCSTPTQGTPSPTSRPRSRLPHQPLRETQNAGVCTPPATHSGPVTSRQPASIGLRVPDTQLVAGQQLWQPLRVGGQQRGRHTAQPDGHGHGGPEFGQHSSSVWTTATWHSVWTTVHIMKHTFQTPPAVRAVSQTRGLVWAKQSALTEVCRNLLFF